MLLTPDVVAVAGGEDTTKNKPLPPTLNYLNKLYHNPLNSLVTSYSILNSIQLNSNLKSFTRIPIANDSSEFLHDYVR